MIKQKPTDYSQPVHCIDCGEEITDDVWINSEEGLYPRCYGCFIEAADEEVAVLVSKSVPRYDVCGDWRSMSVCEYLDECNDRAYDAYVDRCVDEQRDREVFG